ncbi:hypothetical protein [Clostridium rectalis]|uniref:hypothetical protein n=1 Tax=Clostridium rectalis TaxID=2040295 RepID=UPI0013DDDF02|nr:hypothetical protein [Clostridium rectalis]
MDSKKVYAPEERDYLEAKQKIIKSFSKKDYTKLPDNVRDPVVVNNIATWEFDNTSKDMEENNLFE